MSIATGSTGKDLRFSDEVVTRFSAVEPTERGK